MRTAILLVAVATVVAACGDGGSGSHSAVAIGNDAALSGVYDATVSEQGDDDGVARVRIGRGDVFPAHISLALAPLARLDLSGTFEPPGVFSGILVRDGDRVRVDGTAHADRAGGIYRIRGEVGGGGVDIAFVLEHPVAPIETGDLDGAIALGFSESPGGGGCPSGGVSRIRFDTSRELCVFDSVIETPERADRAIVDDELSDADCWRSPSGRFHYRGQYEYSLGAAGIGYARSALDLFGTMQTANGRIAGDGIFARQGIPEVDADVAGRWTIAPPACGDGTTGPGETCDDGNIASGDGCSAHCQNERPTTCGANDRCCLADDPSNPSAFDFVGTYDADVSEGHAAWQTVAAVAAETRRRFTLTLPLDAPWEASFDGRLDTGGHASIRGTAYGSDYTYGLTGTADFTTDTGRLAIRLVVTDDFGAATTTTTASLQRPRDARVDAGRYPLTFVLAPSPDQQPQGRTTITLDVSPTGDVQLTGGAISFPNGTTAKVEDGHCLLSPSARLDCRAGYTMAIAVPPYSEPASVPLVFGGITSGPPAFAGSGSYVSDAYPFFAIGDWTLGQ